MLDEICAEIKNYFTYESDRVIGDFSISNGVLSPSFEFPTNYFRIVGSHNNDGIHKVSDQDLVDEGKFHGSVWLMSPPKDFLDLVAEIEAWQEKYGAADSINMSPFGSENFGGYGYTKANVSAGPGGSSVPTWQTTYASRLKRYRRLRVI